MKLYKVCLEYETVIRATSPEEAIQEASSAIHYEIDDPPIMTSAEEITKLEDLPPLWDARCRPWGKRDPEDKTIGEILQTRKSLSFS